MSANGEDLTPPHGTPAREMLHQHDSDIRALRKSATSLASSVIALETWKGEVMVQFAKVHQEIGDLSTDVRRSIRPPAMRSELPSSLDPRELRTELREAAFRGEKDPRTTAEAEVEKVLERVELIRRGRMFNRILWLAFTGAAGLALDRIILALIHH